MAYNAGAYLNYAKSHADNYSETEYYKFNFKYSPAVYSTFLFDKYLKSNGLKFKNIDYYKKTIEWIDRDKRHVQGLITEFESSITCKRHRFTQREGFGRQDGPGLSKLIFHENGVEKEGIRTFLEGFVEQSKNQGIFYVELYKVKDGPGCNVYANDELTCSSIIKQIENAFDRHKVEKGKLTEKLYQFVHDWQQKDRLETVDKPGKPPHILIYCTHDITFELVQILSEPPSEVIDVADHYLEFLQHYGKGILQAEGHKCNVTPSIDFRNKTLLIQGNREDRQRFIERMKSLIFKEVISLKAPVTEYESKDFDDIASINECTWSCRFQDQTDEPSIIEGCEYISTYYHPAYQGNISCIAGDIWELKFDGLILLVNDNLTPLHKLDGNDTFFHDFTQTETYKSHCIGDVVCEKILNKSYCWHTIKVVTEYANKYSSSSTFSSFVKSNLGNQIVRKRCKTVCLPVTAMGGSCGIDDYVNKMLDTYINEKWIESGIQLYLCMERNFKDCKLIQSTVKEKLKRAKWKTLRKDYRTDGEDDEDGLLQTISIRASSNSLQDINVDVIVNPTRQNLDLSKGYVSNSLLESAGKELQERCRNDCPEGLSVNQVLVTPAFKLRDRNKRLKVIIHAALPLFSIMSYRSDVKTVIKLCLMKAEELGLESIAFSALGTGQHGNPKRETINAMFDAVEEFGKHRLVQNIRSVVFALPDDESIKIFNAEKFRRSVSYQSYLPETQETERLKGTIKSKKGEVSVIFGHSFDRVPWYTADVKFVNGMTTSFVFEYADEKSTSIYDSLTVLLDVANTDSELVKSAIKSCLTFCKSLRITAILLPRIAGIKLSTVDYYKVVVEEIQNFVKDGGSDRHCYISKIYINVTSREMNDLESQFPETASLLTSMLLRSSISWQKYKASATENHGYIQVLGKSKESVCRVKEDMLRFMGRRANFDEKLANRSRFVNGTRPKEKQSIPNNNNDAATNYTGKPPNHVLDEEGGGLVEGKGDVERMIVSAELNPGFIEFKKKFQDLDRWILRIEHVFTIYFEKQANTNTCRVKGTYKNLSALKYYLDNEFPADPKADTMVEATKKESEKTKL